MLTITVNELSAQLINGEAPLVPGQWHGRHVITDPPYDMNMDDLYEALRGTCDGNIVMFSELGKGPTGADEYHVWEKPESTKNFSLRCGRFIEQISIFKGKGPFNEEKLHWSQLTGIHRDRLADQTVHPWQKPLELMRRLVRLYTSIGDTVIDPFAGSGTTVIAAVTAGRNGTAYENDPGHFTNMVERFRASFTDTKVKEL